MCTVHKKTKLTLMFWNCQGIRSKVEELSLFLKSSSCDIVCLSETFLKNNHRFALDGFACIRNDRTSGRLGGLAILIRNDLVYKQITCPLTNLVEVMGIEIECDNKKLIIMNAYLPGGAKDSEVGRHFQSDLISLTNTSDPFCIVGDLNAKHTDWHCCSNNAAGNILRTTSINNNFFVEHPGAYTYCPMSVHMSHSTIDLMLTNHKHELFNIYTRNIFSSDHVPVVAEIGISVEFVSKIKFNYRYADWPKFREIVNTKLDDIMTTAINSPADIDKAVERLNKIVQTAEEHSVPKCKSGSDNIFLDSHTKFLCRLRNLYRRRYLRYHDPLDNNICISLRNMINANLKTLRNERWEKKLSDCDTDHTKVFRLTKSFKRKQFDIPTLPGAVSAVEKANKIADKFVENHSNPLKNKNRAHTNMVNRTVNEFLNQPSIPPDQSEFINYQETVNIVKKLKNNKSPGEDNISPRLIKNLPNRALFFITYIFNMALFFAYFPLAWRSARVIPIHKPGKPTNDPSSYRPISLLSVLGKVFERLLLKRIQAHISSTELLPQEQFGFRTGHSTSLQLLRVVNQIKQNFNYKKSTGFLSLDVEKAFDRVWHNGLLYKLINNNFPMYVVKLVSSFLTSRSFSVSVGQAESGSFPIEFGVPQGSVLSPTLYNIYTHDLPRLRNCETAVFADDTGIYSSSRFYKQIRRNLEAAAKKLSRYFLKWKISLNNDKTEAIFFTRRRKKQKPRFRDKIRVGNALLPWKDGIRYLGCYLDPRLTLKEHITKNINKSVAAIKSLYPIIHRRSVLSQRLKTNIYKLYFRPVLTYPCIVSYTLPNSTLKRLQVQQNKLLRMANNKDWGYNTSKLHQECGVKYIKDHLHLVYERAHLRGIDSENPLIQSIW